VLLSNRLAVVLRADGPPAPHEPAELREPRFRRIAIGDPAGVPAGVYARAYLSSLGLWDALAPRMVPTRSVRAALAVVEAGDADAGIVYHTDALSSDEVAVAFEVPEDEGPPIAYPAAVLVDAPNPSGAARFLAYLRSTAARRVFGLTEAAASRRAVGTGPSGAAAAGRDEGVDRELDDELQHHVALENGGAAGRRASRRARPGGRRWLTSGVSTRPATTSATPGSGPRWSTGCRMSATSCVFCAGTRASRRPPSSP